MIDENQWRTASRQFLNEAWAALAELRVVPLSRYQADVRVGRDYAGADVMGLASFATMAALVQTAHPRFSAPLGSREWDSANGYVLGLLEDYVALLSRDREAPEAQDAAAETALRDLLEAVRADETQVACSRVVSPMTTLDKAGLEIAGLRVTPVDAPAHDLTRTTRRLLDRAGPGAGTVYARALGEHTIDVATGDQCVVTAFARGTDVSAATQEAQSKIERFLFLTRLLRHTTAESVCQIVADTKRIGRVHPYLERLRGPGGTLAAGFLAPSPAVLGPDDVAALDALSSIVESARQTEDREGMAFTSFALARSNFTLSYHAEGWDEQVIGLATALEAALSGVSTSDVTLRLKIRASGLLACDDDPAGRVFTDVGALYGLRSTLVHGGSNKYARLIRTIRSLSGVTAPEGSDGVAMAQGVERLRDLVRRALLARICLAAGEPPMWPLNAQGREDAAVDAAMADDVQRARWRNSWRQTLGPAQSAAQPRALSLG